MTHVTLKERGDLMSIYTFVCCTVWLVGALLVLFGLHRRNKGRGGLGAMTVGAVVCGIDFVMWLVGFANNLVTIKTEVISPNVIPCLTLLFDAVLIFITAFVHTVVRKEPARQG
jgi:hypothetical protein